MERIFHSQILVIYSSCRIFYHSTESDSIVINRPTVSLSVVFFKYHTDECGNHDQQGTIAP